MVVTITDMEPSRPIAVEDVRHRLEELTELWEHGAGRVTMLRRDGEIVGLTIYGLASHCVALARAVRILDDAGEGAQIVPLVRQMLECMITAVWVQTYGSRAAIKLQREDARARVAAFKQFVKAGASEDGSASRWQEEVEWLDPLTTKASEKLYERCDELEGFEGHYAMYRALSALSHAGAMVVDLYAHEGPGSQGEPGEGLVLSTRAKEWARVEVLRFALVYLLSALYAWDTYEQNHPRRTRLKQIGAEMGVPLGWRQTALGFAHQQEWDKAQRALRRTGKPS